MEADGSLWRVTQKYVHSMWLSNLVLLKVRPLSTCLISPANRIDDLQLIKLSYFFQRYSTWYVPSRCCDQDEYMINLPCVVGS